MKKDIHIESFPVIFRDTEANVDFFTTSTMKGETTETHNNIEYSVITIEVSSASHPFYTGEARVMDTAGRVEKFKSRVAKKKS